MLIEFAKKIHDRKSNPVFSDFVKRIEMNDREMVRNLVSEKRFEDTFTPIVYDRRVQLRVMNEIPDYDMVNSDIIIDRDDPLVRLSVALARYKTTNQFALNMSTEFVTYDDEQGRFDTLRRCKALYDRLMERLESCASKFGYSKSYHADYSYILGEIRVALKHMIENISYAVETSGGELSNRNLFFLVVTFINNMYRAYEGFRRLVVPEFVFGLLKGNVEELNFYRYHKVNRKHDHEERILELKNVQKASVPKMVTRKTFVNKEIDRSLSNGVYNGMLFAELCDNGIIKQGSDKCLYRTDTEKNIILKLKDLKLDLANGKNTSKIGVNRIQTIFKEHKVKTLRELKNAKKDSGFFLMDVTSFDSDYFVAAQRNFKLNSDSSEILENVNDGIINLVQKLSEEPGKYHFKNYFRACFYRNLDERSALELNEYNNQIIEEVHENYRLGRKNNDFADSMRYKALEDELITYGLSENKLIGLNEPEVEDYSEEYKLCGN